MALVSAQKMALAPSLIRGLTSSQLVSHSSRIPAVGLSSASATKSTTGLNTSLPQHSANTVRGFHNSPRNGAPNTGMMGLGGSGIPPSYFQKSSLPANTIIRFVPQQTAWIVERMGKFNRILQPGLAILVPFIDRIAYVKSLKEAAIEIPSQSAITADNVTLELDGVLYTRVFDAYKARFVRPPSLLVCVHCRDPTGTNMTFSCTATESKTPSTPSANSRRPPCAAR